MAEKAPRIAIIAGEESGDLLAADLIAALNGKVERDVDLIGVGGKHLKEHGLASLFDAEDIALMGVSAILRDLPRLMRRIGETARVIAKARPDCLITVDSPEFSLRVAKKVRALAPEIPIIHYVCPSVWAWRPGRAKAMRPYVNEILCLLPFEPEALERLGGPAGTFVGHRLATHPGIEAAAKAHIEGKKGKRGAKAAKKNLLVLPGSRRGEVSRLIDPFGKAIAEITSRTDDFTVTIPTVPHVQALVERETANWPLRPKIVFEEAQKWQAFAEADAALACSGTVSLELALARIPTVVCYKTDLAARALLPLITVWSAALPNLIAGWPVVPEHFNQFIRPGYLARQVMQLWDDTPTRVAQMAGFQEVAEALATEKPSGEIAADVVLRHIHP